MNEAFQKSFVDMVILETCWHLFVKISWFPRGHYLNIYGLIAGLAKLCIGVKKVSVIGTINCSLYLFDLIHFF